MTTGVITIAPPGGVRDYALIIDETYDAVLLRDLLQHAAQEAHTRASKATQRKALNDNTAKYECFSRYADRCAYIIKENAERIAKDLRRANPEYDPHLDHPERYREGPI